MSVGTCPNEWLWCGDSLCRCLRCPTDHHDLRAFGIGAKQVMVVVSEHIPAALVGTIIYLLKVRPGGIRWFETA